MQTQEARFVGAGHGVSLGVPFMIYSRARGALNAVARYAGRLWDALEHLVRSFANAVAARAPDIQSREQMHLELALTEVAIAAASGHSDPLALFDLLTARLVALVGATGATIVRFDGEHGELVGSHGSIALADGISLQDSSAAAEVGRTGHVAQVYEQTTGYTAGAPVAHPATTARRPREISVPVHIDDELWGALSVTTDHLHGLPVESGPLLERVAELISAVVHNAQKLDRLQRQATTDPLTGLLNSRGFQERLELERSRAKRHCQPLALLLFDIDAFKQVNDIHGHQTGDLVLEIVGRVLQQRARAEDAAARLGGDEFALIAPATDTKSAIDLAERLRAHATADIAKLGVATTLSAGVSELDRTPHPSELIRSADSSLYRAKRHGGDRTSTELSADSD